MYFLRAICKDSQTYADPNDKLPTDVEWRMVAWHPIQDSIIFGLGDTSHMFKNLRNNVASSQEGGKKALVVSATKSSMLDPFNEYIPPIDSTFDFSVDSSDNRVTLSDILYRDHRLALIDWKFGFEDPFTEYQNLQGYRSISSGILGSIFEAVKTSGAKMNVGDAMRFHNDKIQKVEDTYCENALSAPKNLIAAQITMIRSVEGYRSWKIRIRSCQHLCNGIDTEATKKCVWKEKVRERLFTQSKSQILSFRSLARMMDDGYKNLTQAINVQKKQNALIYDCRNAEIVNDEIHRDKNRKKMAIKDLLNAVK
jgi:hypothetical protein